MVDNEQKRVNHFMLYLLAISLLSFSIMLQFSFVASAATDISGLDAEIGTALGIGDTAGGLVIVVALILVADLVLGVLGVQFQIMLLVDVMLAGLVTAIGWLDAGVFVVILVIVALMFSPKIANIFWPGGTE